MVFALFDPWAPQSLSLASFKRCALPSYVHVCLCEACLVRRLPLSLAKGGAYDPSVALLCSTPCSGPAQLHGPASRQGLLARSQSTGR